MTPFYITTPIYYVNDAPHIGHAYTTILADTIARWHRARGREVRFQTGTDEHGQKVYRAAQKLGRTPQEHTDLLHLRFKDLFAKLGVRYDRFIRTTEPAHVRVVQALLTRLHEAGELYEAEYAGWYSTSAERFWTEEEVAAASQCSVEDLRSGRVQGVCPDSGTPVEWLSETNWFFRMSAWQGRLIEHIEQNPECITPAWRRNEVLGYLRKPLADLCISRPRARLPWGIPIPFAPEHVTYVWFDALTNYISGAGYLDDPAAFARWWSESVHLIGKDILTFHTVYWFSMLMAFGLTPPKQVVAHGWWLRRGTKMSKSLGNVVPAEKLVDAFGADAVRYYFLREIPLGGDGEFTLSGFLTRYNADLANDLGNLAHRALSMSQKWLGGVVPEKGPVAGTDAELAEVAARAAAGFAENIEKLQYRQALEALWELVRYGNKYIDTEEPWALNKRGDTARLGAVLRNAMEACRIAAAHLACVMPERAPELLSRLGGAAPDLSPSLDRLAAGAPVDAREPLFPRFLEFPGELAAEWEAERAEAAKPAEKPAKAPKAPKEPRAPKEPAPPSPTAAPAAAGPSTPTPASPPVSDETPAVIPEITYDDFAKLALRTGKVLSADRHPNADRLLVLKVDVGEAEPRTIVAGIADAYTPEELVGRTIVVVANLKPAKLRGVMSQGMLLAAGGAGVAALLSPIKDVPPGTIVK